MSDKDLWVLVDSRVGTSTQAIALAENLSMSFEVKKLEYNFWAFLPNFILGATKVHIKNKSSDFEFVNHPPKVIISAGRRSAAVALFFKKKYPEIKLIQIMKPFLDHSKFDFIVLPQHDQCESSNNIIRIIGSLHNIEEKLKTAAGSIKLSNPNFQHFIAVLIGGNTKNHKFSEEMARSLAEQINLITTNHGINAFISFSRRTPDEIKKIIREKFVWPHMIYDPSNSSEPNPYLGMLADADFIITTSDSVSMCSEASASGKPLYIFCPHNSLIKKHRYFVQQLFDLGIAKLLTKDLERLEMYQYTPLNEVKKVAGLIKKSIRI